MDILRHIERVLLLDIFGSFLTKTLAPTGQISRGFFLGRSHLSVDRLPVAFSVREY